jgi:predicted CopG family antitoxin
MGTKTISITDEAYHILKAKKSTTDSFSEAIVKLAGKKKLASFYGALSEESADALEKAILDGRKRHKTSHKKRLHT